MGGLISSMASYEYDPSIIFIPSPEGHLEDIPPDILEESPRVTSSGNPMEERMNWRLKLAWVLFILFYLVVLGGSAYYLGNWMAHFPAWLIAVLVVLAIIFAVAAEF